MRIGIKQKLVAAILGASVVGTVTMGVATQFGFKRSFLDYLNEQGRARLEIIEPRVVRLYQREMSWSYLRRHPQEWLDIVGLPSSTGASPLPANPEFKVPSNIDITGTSLRISLLDETRHFLIGWPKVAAGAVYRAVIVNDQTVGWLALNPLEVASSQAESRFQQRELLLTCIIGGLAVIGGALVATLLANAFIVPVERIAAATRQLATGSYSVRVPATSEDELGTLANDVNHLAMALDRHESMRRNLMADVSHELRTPLAVLRAELEALEDGVRDLSRNAVQSLLAEVTTLSKLVDDVHDLAVADIGALSYRKSAVDVAQVLQTCVVAFRERFEQCSLVVESNGSASSLRIFADERRLMQLFNNLLENSARYTDAGGKVRINAHRVGDNASIVIDDSPPGVGDDLLPQLFERFFRVDPSRSRATGGSGLGMAICRSIVEAHGGSIVARQSPLGGLRIVLELPLVDP